MAYIVNGPVYGTFQKQSFAVNGSETEFALGNKVSAATSLLVVSNGEIIEPNVAYSVINGGTKIKFTSAPVNPTYAIFLGKQFLVPSAQGYETALEQFVGNGVKTTFTLTSNPVVNSGLIVFVDGIQQTYGLGKNFTLSGLDIIFTSPPPNGVEIDVYVIARERIGIEVPADGTISRPKLNDSIKNSVGIWQTISTNTAATDGDWYNVNTASSPVTITLPALVQIGTTFKISDLAGTFATNNCTIGRNGKKINGLNENLVLDLNFADVELRFTGEDYGWRVIV